MKGKNIWLKYKNLTTTKKENEELVTILRKYDFYVNVKWKLVHFKSAVKHLKSKGIKKATGGTNWEKYLPPRFQKIIFFPEIWTKKEKEEWGISWLKN